MTNDSPTASLIAKLVSNPKARGRARLQATSVLVAGVLSSLATPAAAHTASDCQPAIRARLQSANFLTVMATRVTARGAGGFTSFSMAPGYEVESTPLHTPPAAWNSYFVAEANSAHTSASGHFTEVFPGRGNGDEDDWSFWINTDAGTIWLRSNTWAGSWVRLEQLQCYAGPRDQLVVTAHAGSQFGSFGPEFWTFLLKESACGEVLC